MDPQSFIIGLMAGITFLGGAILTAMIVLEQSRYPKRTCTRLFIFSRGRLRHWLQQKWFGQRITEHWSETEADLARQREQVFHGLERKRTKRPANNQPGDRAHTNGRSKDF